MMNLEMRVVCAHFGDGTRHTTHKFPKGTMKKAQQSVIDLNHQAEMRTEGFYSNEAPYRVETRQVTAWTDKEIE